MADRDSDWENSGEAACGWVQWGILVGEDRSLCEEWQEKWEEMPRNREKIQGASLQIWILFIRGFTIFLFLINTW